MNRKSFLKKLGIGAVARSILDHTGQPIELEGVIEIWDDMPVLNVSAGSLKPVP